MRRICWVLAFFLLVVGCAKQTPPANLDSTAMATIQDAIFEVVVPKPTRDSLSYAKPLPMELLPYSFRTDAYYSIGTAFAVAPDRFLTAAHVLNMGLGSQFQDYFLRDRQGAVYPIDQIFKYSVDRDFVLFSLKDKKASQVLALNPAPRVNDKVYAVGNALGQGIVIRDGLYTSDTPEELEGAWQWIRFSAAASPGNSGGPLLDTTGRVIGVVMKKSPNENLNFALPIAEVLQFPENRAVVNTRIGYSLDIMEMKKWGTLKREIPLPKTYDELNRELITQIDGFTGELLRDLLEENREDIFPRGPGSTILLHQTNAAIFPNLVMKGEDGNWGTYYPEETTEAEIGRNGSVTYGKLGHSLFIRAVKPDDVPLESFYSDSKLFMDLMLQGVYSTREVGPEKVKITSLGKAHEEYTFTDSYQRKWLVKTWLMEYSDRKLVTFSLPVPGGCITMLRMGQTGQVDNGHIPDLKVLTDFVYVSYYGTLGQWRELLGLPDLLPAAFSSVKIAFDYGKGFQYTSDRFSFGYDPSLLKIDETSDLQLRFAYFPEHDRIMWDVAQVVVGDDRSNGNFFQVSRNIRQPATLSDGYRRDWENIVNRRFPYDGTAYFQDKTTMIAEVFDSSLKQPKLSDNPVIYTATYGVDGSGEQAVMEARLNRFLQNMQVFEY